MTSKELKEQQATLMQRCKDIVEQCKLEVREMTDEEEKEFNANKEECKRLKRELDELKEKIRQYEEELPEDEERECKEDEVEEERADEAPEEDEEEKDEEEKAEAEVEDKSEDPAEEEDKNTRNLKMKDYSILAEVRKAIDNGSMNFTIENRAAATVTVNAGTDNEGGTATGNANVVQKEYQTIIDPLYANSVLGSLGVRTYQGLPMGDVVVPVLGKGTCGWAKEVAKAMKSDNAISTVTLKPHRLCCYVDISNQLLAQDNIQFEEAIRRDIQNAIADKIEATLFGYAAGVTGEKPAGLFYNQNLANATTYGKICDLEATIEENNYTGEMKYLMSPKAKAFVRQTQKSSKNTEGILENGTIDGTQVITTSNVPSKAFIYGSFDTIAVGFWGNIDVKVDDISQAVYGVTRLVLNCYVDFTTIRDNGLVFGTVDSDAAGSPLADATTTTTAAPGA